MNYIHTFFELNFYDIVTDIEHLSNLILSHEVYQHWNDWAKLSLGSYTPHMYQHRNLLGKHLNSSDQMLFIQN